LELLFFGLVRPYKGVDTLCSALAMMDPSEVFLTVAGEWWMRDACLREALRRRPNVEVIDRYVGAEEAASLFSRADAVVLPYRRSSGSGVLAMAYGYGKPVIAGRGGGLADAVVDGVSGVLVPPDDPAAIAAAARRISSRAGTQWEAGVRSVTSMMTWSHLAGVLTGWASSLAEGTEPATACDGEGCRWF
jgi:glycosyltransferase involved in cell wall biosynthesis